MGMMSYVISTIPGNKDAFIARDEQLGQYYSIRCSIKPLAILRCMKNSVEESIHTYVVAKIPINPKLRANLILSYKNPN